MRATILAVSIAFIAVCCGIAAGADGSDGFLSYAGAPLTADPTVVELGAEGSGEKVRVGDDEYPQSGEDVLLLPASAGAEESRVFQERCKLRVDLMTLEVRVTAPGIDPSLLKGKLREYACRNRCNYVREVRLQVSTTVISGDYYASITGIGGFGADQGRVAAWMVSGARDALLNCPFSEKYAAMASTYDHDRLSSLAYWYFVQEYEALKRDNRDDYLIFRELERKYLRIARQCGVTQLHSLDEAITLEMPRNITRTETAVRK